MNTSFEVNWYGNWQLVIASILLSTFVFTVFLAKPKRMDWKSYGLTEAFIISLFTEMFGIPLTIYLLSTYFDISIPINGLTGHLWATLFALTGLMDLETGVAIVMGISLVLIGMGTILLVGGWIQVYRNRDRIADTGLYRYIRHPQYLGIMLIIIGFMVQWPTIPTLIMFPFLIYVYYRQALKEEKIMLEAFGEEYISYMARTPRFNIFSKTVVRNCPIRKKIET